MDDDDQDRVFKALADRTRRALLDRLHARNGQSLAELTEGLGMSRFGVAKHLGILQEAGLVITRREGRRTAHYLNPVPIRQIHHRWMDAYTTGLSQHLIDLKSALEDQP